MLYADVVVFFCHSEDTYRKRLLFSISFVAVSNFLHSRWALIRTVRDLKLLTSRYLDDIIRLDICGHWAYPTI